MSALSTVEVEEPVDRIQIQEAADQAVDQALGRDLPDPRAEPTVPIPRAAAIIGISKNSAYEAAARGELPVIRFGHRMLVPTARLLALLGIDTDAA